MTHPSSDANDEPVRLASSRADVLRFRTLTGIGLLVLITVAGLVGAWYWPARTEWHFLIITQCIPLCYLGLAWWGSHRGRARPDDA